MSDGLLHALTLISALGCGLVGGIFFAFSTFIMKALNRLPPAQGIAAMQSINIMVINPLFMTAFFGPAAACAILAGSTLLGWQPGGAFLVAGSLLYLVGTILVTGVFNVPRNDAEKIWRPSTRRATRGRACGRGTLLVGRPGTTCGQPQPLRLRHCSPLHSSIDERALPSRRRAGGIGAMDGCEDAREIEKQTCREDDDGRAPVQHLEHAVRPPADP